MTPVEKEEFLVYLQDIKEFTTFPEKFLRKLVDILENQTEFNITLQDIVDLVNLFEYSEDRYSNMARLLKKYVRGTEFKEGDKCVTGGRMKRPIYLSNSVVPNLMMRLSGPGTDAVKKYFEVLTKIHTKWVTEKVTKRLTREREDHTKSKRIPLSKLPNYIILKGYKNGCYIIEVIDEQAPYPNTKHKWGSTHDFVERFGRIRREVEGSLRLVHWEFCNDYKALEELVKARLKDYLAPCVTDTYCTETYLLPKEKIQEVMYICKGLLEDSTKKVLQLKRPQTPPTKSFANILF